jgi:EmrB/QacA subfamily drug resistance transporter
MAQPFAEPCSRGVIQAEASARPMTAAHRPIVMTACVLASSMAFIDGSALTVALPKLRAAFAADLTAVQWVLNAYVLTLASTTLIGGALADVHGRARMLSIGCLLFGLTSAACALAPSIEWLIAVRAAQGIAAAIVTPASLALIGAIYPKEERNRAIGVWAAASALTTVGGPVLGGWLTETFGWQSVFWINPPLALLVVGLLVAFPTGDRGEPRRFDMIGAAILAAALGVLAWALSQVGNPPQAGAGSVSNATVALMGGLGVVGLAAYAYWERQSSHPMTPPRLANNRVFVGLNAATLLIYAGLAIMFFLAPFDLVDRRGLSATDAGLTFLPFTLAVGLLSRLFGGVTDSVGARTMLVSGSAGASLAFAWMAARHQSSLLLGVIAPMTMLGIAFAVLITPLTASVISSVQSADEGLASGINNAVSRTAQLIGVALAAGLAAFGSGYELGLAAAAALSMAGAFTARATVPPPQRKPTRTQSAARK